MALNNNLKDKELRNQIIKEVFVRFFSGIAFGALAVFIESESILPRVCLSVASLMMVLAGLDIIRGYISSKKDKNGKKVS